MIFVNLFHPYTQRCTAFDPAFESDVYICFTHTHGVARHFALVSSILDSARCAPPPRPVPMSAPVTIDAARQRLAA